MISWTDAQDKVAFPGTVRYADGVTWSYAAGGVIEDGAAPRIYDQTIVNAVFAAFGDTLRHIAADEDMPVELLAAPICMVAENVGVDTSAHYTNYLPGFLGDDETPEMVYAGCTGLRFDRVRAVMGATVIVPDYVADPSTAITAAARHMLAATDATRFQVPMVAAAYNTDGMRYDAASRWRMGGEIDRFVGWFNTIVQVAQFDPTLISAAPSFTAVLARIAPPAPVVPPTTTTTQRYRRPEAQAASDAGMMTISGTNPGLCAIWSLDDTTLMQIGNVAKDAASGMGLPMGLPVFAYPDRGGTMRMMNTAEVQSLYRAMRDYVMAITMYDTGRADGLPGQPVGIG